MTSSQLNSIRVPAPGLRCRIAFSLLIVHEVVCVVLRPDIDALNTGSDELESTTVGARYVRRPTIPLDPYVMLPEGI